MSGVIFPAGFRAVAVEAAIKKPGNYLKKDLVIIVSDKPAAAAGVFTTNQFAAAPVVHSRKIIREGGPVRAIVVNAGNANAGTGDTGLSDAAAMARMTASELALGIDADEVLVASTGVIGRPMPMDRVACGIERAVSLFKTADESQSNCWEAARAIMTTDTVEKIAERTIPIEAMGGVRGGEPRSAAQGSRSPLGVRSGFAGTDVRIVGIAKGAGMIHPDMATMLAFIMTDAALGREVLQPMLERVVRSTFNAISVDNDMSTNDTVFLLANGCHSATLQHRNSNARDVAMLQSDTFEHALEEVCHELALKIVADGEGATKVVTIEVTGAANGSDAALAADAVATSMLVKTALFGNDPNWGRILAAVGRSGATIDTNRIRIDMVGSTLFLEGSPTEVDLENVAERMKQREILIQINIGLGTGARTVYTTDLTRDYVSINADYTT